MRKFLAIALLLLGGTSLGLCQGPSGGSTSKSPVAITFNIQSPTLADSGLWQFKVKKPITAIELSCSVNAGGTASVSIEIRPENAPNSAGTDILNGTPISCSSTPNCATSTGCTKTFVTAAIPANSYVTPKITATTATMLRISFTAQ